MASSMDSTLVPENVTDESMRTFWSARSGEPGEWLQISLEGLKEVRAIQLNYYEHRPYSIIRRWTCIINIVFIIL